MNKCWYCGEEAIAWDSDDDLEDFGEEDFLFRKNYYCMKCGAWIEYYIPADKEEGES